MSKWGLLILCGIVSSQRQRLGRVWSKSSHGCKHTADKQAYIQWWISWSNMPVMLARRRGHLSSCDTQSSVSRHTCGYVATVQRLKQIVLEQSGVLILETGILFWSCWFVQIVLRFWNQGYQFHSLTLRKYQGLSFTKFILGDCVYWLAFMDVKSAFDVVVHQNLMRKLYNSGNDCWW